MGDDAWLRVDAGPFDKLEIAPDVAAPGVVSASALSANFLADDRIFDAPVGLEPTSVVAEAGRAIARFELAAPHPAAVPLLHIDEDAEVSLEGHVELDLDSGVIVAWELRAAGPPSELPDGVAQQLPRDIDVASLAIRFRITGIDDPSVEVVPPETLRP